MIYLRFCFLVCGTLVGLGCMGSSSTHAGIFSFFSRSNSPQNLEQANAAACIPIQQLHPSVRQKVAQVLGSPTLYSNGPSETFICQPKLYYWLMDNPDRTMVAWERLGAQCLQIQPRGNGHYSWADDKGSDVRWHTIYLSPTMRVWYAEGKVKPTALLPMLPVKCVVMMRYDTLQKDGNKALLQHQADVFVHTDSRAAKVVARLLGPSMPEMAKQGVAQLQMFYAAMAWYCAKNPEHAQELLRVKATPQSEVVPVQMKTGEHTISPYASRK